MNSLEGLSQQHIHDVAKHISDTYIQINNESGAGGKNIDCTERYQENITKAFNHLGIPVQKEATPEPVIIDTETIQHIAEFLSETNIKNGKDAGIDLLDSPGNYYDNLRDGFHAAGFVLLSNEHSR